MRLAGASIHKVICEGARRGAWRIMGLRKYSYISTSTASTPKGPLIEPSWPLIVGVWGILEGTWGV